MGTDQVSASKFEKQSIDIESIITPCRDEPKYQSAGFCGSHEELIVCSGYLD